MPRPNILFIHSDQHRFDCLGVNGHPLVQTPNLDRLAHEGVNFTSAYTPAPVCVPSRNSLQYGCWPTQHLAIANDGTEAPRPAREGLVSFSEMLHEAGYHLGCVGKWQVHPRRSPLEFGYNRYISDGDYRSWRATQNLPPEPHRNGFWGEVDPGILPEQSALGWGATQVINELKERAGAIQPFFLRWDTNEPHLPCVVPEPFYSQITPESVSPWLSFPDPMVGKPYIQSQQKRSWKLDGWSWEQWAPLVARYLGVVSLLDAQVGRILDTLQQLGLAENTMVVYSTDHGDLCGGHGLIDKHYVMYEDVTHVPLIIRWPGRATAGARCDAFVSHALDLALTFCEAAQARVPATFCGRSLLPLLDGKSDNSRREIVSTYFGNQFGLYSQRMLRDRRYKYIWNLTAEDELYDLVGDAGELHNLTNRPEYLQILAGLRQRLLAWMEETRDPLLNMWTRAQLAENRKI